MLILGILIALLTGNFSTARAENADDCSPRNLYEEPSSPLHDIPIYDQAETSLCYAYTTAQLTEFSLRKSGQLTGDTHLDALWIAIAYKGGNARGLHLYNNRLGNGFFNTAFHDLEAIGICDPVVFNGAIQEYKQGSLLADADYFLLFEMLWDLRLKSPDLFIPGREDYPTLLTLLLKDETFKVIRERSLKAMPRKETAHIQFDRDLTRLYTSVAGISATEFSKNRKIAYLRNVVFRECNGPNLWKPELPKARTTGLAWESNATLKSEIDRMLDAKDPLPVNIGYCSGVLSTNEKRFKDATRRNPLLPRISKAAIYSCGAHYSVIVGRRKNEAGACQYLIRNSYGRDFWTRRYECLCENGGQFEACRYDANTSPKSDKVVGCWIDQDPLLNSLYDVSVLSP